MMIIEGEFQINASLQHTWDFLMNIEEVASCIPSCQNVEVFDEKSFAVTISQKVGPISVTFETQTNLIEVNPPNHLVAFGKGKDTRMGSSFELTNNMDLVQISEKETLVKYKTDVKISGRLASVGQSMIKILAKREVAKVVKLIQNKIGGESDEEL
jgi:carbon monoxide dehydrogenase subunit G